MAALQSYVSLTGSLPRLHPASGAECVSSSWLEPVLSGQGRMRLQLRPTQFPRNTKQAGRRRFSHGATRAETALLDAEPAHQSVAGPEETEKQELFACPICFEPLIRKGVPGNRQAAVVRSGFKCQRCKKAYSTRDVFLDLTLLSGAREYEETLWGGTELFRSPVVSFIYERGWRQNFERTGFPGPDEEFRMAQEYFKPTFGGLLVDVSCGSGLFTRRFAQSGLYKSVIALDYSENMLRQTSEFIKQDKSLDNSDIVLIRADVARLPFATGSVDAIHAGAAIHCWPSPSSALAEISRVLRPGGVFVATTFLLFAQPFILKPIRQALRQARQSSMRRWEEPELAELCKLSGLENFQKWTKGSFIMFSARKPKQAF